MSASCRVTVVGEGRRADLTLPATAPLADLIGDVADVVVGRSPDALPDPLLLARTTGPALPLDRSLEELGVVDGDVLVLRPAAEAADVPVVDDLAEAVNDALDRRPGHWTPTERRRLLPLSGALIAALGGVAHLGPLAGTLDVVSLLAFALGLLATGAVLVRMAPSGRAGEAVAAASLPWFAAAPVGPLEVLTVTPGSAVAGWGLGLLVGLALLAVVAPRLQAPAAGAGIVAAAGGVAGAALMAGFRAVDVAAVLAVVLVALLYLLPMMAMRASGLLGVSDGATVSEVDRVVDRGRRLQYALLGGTAVAASAAATALAWLGAGAAPLLAAVVGGCLLLRARSLDFTSEVVAVGGPGLAACVLVAAALVARVPGLGAAGIAPVTVLLGLGLALGGELAGSGGSPGWRRFLRRAEVAGAVALVPLCLAVVGFFGTVAGVGASLGLGR